MSVILPPFHLAIPVHSLELAEQFYGELLGCSQGRRAETWTDYNFFGHQLVCHLSKEHSPAGKNLVDGDSIPVPHYGVVLTLQDWHNLVAIVDKSSIDYVLAPKTRFAGEAGEQSTFFIQDFSGNVFEFKGFAQPGNLFKS